MAQRLLSLYVGAHPHINAKHDNGMLVAMLLYAIVRNANFDITLHCREVAQRLLSLREHISKEMVEDLGRVAADNADVMKRTLEKTFTELKFE